MNQQADRERVLREVTQKIRQTLDLQTIFNTACQEVCQAFEADRVGIFKFYIDSGFDFGEFVAESVVNNFISVLAVPVEDHCFGNNFANLYLQGKYFAIDDIYEGGLTTCHTNILAQFQIQANLVIPLLSGEQLWGLLCIHQCDAPRHWQTAEIELAQQLAQQLAIAIQQASLYEQMQTELKIRQTVEAKIAVQLEQQRALSQITHHIRESLDLQQILSIVTQQVQAIMQCDRVMVFRLFPDGKSQILEEVVLPAFPSLQNITLLDETWSQDILELYWQGQPRIVPDVMNDQWTECLREYSQIGQIKSKIVAPILQEINHQESHRWVDEKENHKLWGILVVHACQEQRKWQESEAHLLQQIANQLAISIQQIKLFEQLQQELKERQQAQQKLTQMNKQLAISNEELARATRLKDEFLANMSHELRTPLNAILGLTEGLQEDVFGILNDRQKQALQTVESSANHLLSLINDILDLAKIEAGQVNLEYSLVNIQQLCQSSLVFIKQQALKKQLRLNLQIAQNLPSISIDERRIRQVLINLLTNAVKFTPEGGNITLEVVLQPASPIVQVQFSVIDTGIGISTANLDNLFKPFVQLDSALNRQYTGTGLGLSLVKRLVELHDGTINVSSIPQQGSCFTFNLPITPLCEINNHTQFHDLSSPPETVSKINLHSYAILLAEDNETNVITISSYLKAKGYRLIFAENGRQAIEIALSQPLDLIIMDIQMPEVDGLMAMREIRSHPHLADVPIIALTALAMSGDREKCLEAGANEYLTKPVKLRQLLEVIQELLKT